MSISKIGGYPINQEEYRPVSTVLKAITCTTIISILGFLAALSTLAGADKMGNKEQEKALARIKQLKPFIPPNQLNRRTYHRENIPLKTGSDRSSENKDPKLTLSQVADQMIKMMS